MRELIIGQDGFIGRNLCRHIPEATRTTRRNAAITDRVSYFDLAKSGPLPNADVVYLCAGINGTLTCANDPQRSYRVNVDGTISVAEHYRKTGGFVVWISSTTVEWLTEHYGRQKRTAENHLRMLPNVGIVRAGRVLQSNVDDLCETMMWIGRGLRHGIVLWNEEERPYEH